ncbi:hypothetical protein M1590_02390 [Candidatus Marsarchaeota archaeon]|nr:hypothetical protein [Candidatus Marsarchaeota archaeon]
MNANNELKTMMTKEEIIGVIGDHATFVKKEKLDRMVLTKKEEYLMAGLRIYIIVILSVIILSILGVV